MTPCIRPLLWKPLQVRDDASQPSSLRPFLCPARPESAPARPWEPTPGEGLWACLVPLTGPEAPLPLPEPQFLPANQEGREQHSMLLGWLPCCGTLSHPHSLSRTYSLSHTPPPHTQSAAHTFTLAHTPLTLSYTHILSHSRIHSPTHSLTLTPSHSHTFSLSQSHTLTYTHSPTHILSLTYSLTHSHSLT